MKSRQIKVLQITIGGKNFTGVASYLYQYYKYMDRSKVHFDFLFCRENSMAIKMDDHLFCDSKFYVLNAVKKNTSSNDYFKIIVGLRNILTKEQYDVVVVNTSVVLVIMACALANFPHRTPSFITHAHNTEIILENNALRKKIGFFMNIVDGVCRFFINRYSSFFLACSELAGNYTFGRRITKSNKFMVIRNAIDIQKFRYDTVIRDRIRLEMGVDSNIHIIGNVGQLIKRKNQKFLIEIFSEIYKRQSNFELWIIGEGYEKEELFNLIEKLNLKDSVKMLGQRDDVSDLMQAMDCFVFTTLSEGLGIVAIEAQATGLITFVSDGLPKDVLITDLAYQLPLSGSTKMWADTVLEVVKNTKLRKDTSSEIVRAGYDIISEADRMTNFYVSLMNKINTSSDYCKMVNDK